VSKAHRAPGSPEEESILVAATAFLFAEGVETGASIGAPCGGTSIPPPHDAPMTMGCSTRFEEGSHLLSLRGHCPTNGRVGPSLGARRPTSPLHHRLDHPRRNRRWNSECRLARDTSNSGDLLGSTLGSSCTARERRSRGCVARCLPVAESEGLLHAVCAEPARTGSKGSSMRRGRKRPPAACASEDWTLGVALARRIRRSRSRWLVVLA